MFHHLDDNNKISIKLTIARSISLSSIIVLYSYKGYSNGL